MNSCKSTPLSIRRRIKESFVRRFVEPIRYERLLRDWSHHADQRELDWDWSTPNFNRIALVNLLLSRFDDPSYLEIGCASNELFNSVPAKNKTGVDPACGGTIRKTSDAFFESNKASFDVVFIDGLHTYEQVRRDVINSLKCLNKGGWIALHDMLPRNWIEQHVPIISRGAWTGDVWKVAFELMEAGGIEFKILKIDHGVGVIKLLDRSARLPDLTSNLRCKQFDFFYDHVLELPLFEWDQAQDWLLRD